MMKNFSMKNILFGCIIGYVSIMYVYSNVWISAFPDTNRIIGKDFAEQRLNFLQSFQEEAFCTIPAWAKVLASILEDTGYNKREFEIFEWSLELSREELASRPIILNNDDALKQYCQEPIIVQILLRSPRGEIFRVQTFTDNHSPQCHLILAVEESSASQIRGSSLSSLSTWMFTQKPFVVDKNYFVLATKQESSMLDRDTSHLPKCQPNIRLKK